MTNVEQTHSKVPQFPPQSVVWNEEQQLGPFPYGKALMTMLTDNLTVSLFVPSLQ